MLAGILGSQLQTTVGWRGLFIAGGVVPLIAAAALSRLLPESPRFLARHPARWPELRQFLARLGRQVPSDVAFEDLTERAAARPPLSSLFAADLRRDLRTERL
jgi:AAHS family 4-hydroxybenzoate transporter-like MFS transporter